MPDVPLNPGDTLPSGYVYTGPPSHIATEDYEGFKLPTGAVGIYYKGTEVERIFNEVGAQLHLVDVPRLFY